MDTHIKVHTTIGLEPYTSRNSMRGHIITGDEPVEKGGHDHGPTSTEIVLSGLGSCTAATIKMYADRKQWPLDRVNLDIGIRIERHEDGSQTTHIDRILHVEGPLDEEQKKRMLLIADKCPVHRMLTNKIVIHTTVAEV